MPLQRITTNLQGATIRRDTMAGREYMVVPMVMLKEGVYTGSNGPLYYPAIELKKTPTIWNHKPVVVYHPDMDKGTEGSACNKSIIESQGVGLIMNTRYGAKTGKLAAEAWIEPDRLEKVHEEAYDRLTRNESQEVSTGLFAEYEDTAGDFGGRKYEAIARNYRPDHLAILPDQKGACSMADGAGLLMNYANTPENIQRACKLMAEWEQQRLTSNAKSYGNVQSDLYGQITTKYGDTAWLQDVYDGFCIYSLDGKLYRVNYSTSDDGNKVTLSSDTSEEVMRVSEYRTVGGAFVGNACLVQNKEVNVDRKLIVDGLVANSASKWQETDRAFLMGLTDDVFAKVVAPVTNTQPTPTPPPTLVVPPVVTQPVTNAQPAAVQPLTFGQLFQMADPATKAMLGQMQHNYNAQKSECVGKILANQANAFTKEFLETKELPELQGIAVLANSTMPLPGGPAMFREANFAGAQGAPVANAQGAGPAPADLVMPTMNFAK